MQSRMSLPSLRDSASCSSGPGPCAVAEADMASSAVPSTTDFTPYRILSSSVKQGTSALLRPTTEHVRAYEARELQHLVPKSGKQQVGTGGLSEPPSQGRRASHTSGSYSI